MVGGGRHEQHDAQGDEKQGRAVHDFHARRQSVECLRQDDRELETQQSLRAGEDHPCLRQHLIDLLMQPGLFADALLSFGHGSLRFTRGPFPPDFDGVPEKHRNDPDRRAGCDATGRAEYSLTGDADIDGEADQKGKQRDGRSLVRQRMNLA